MPRQGKQKKLASNDSPKQSPTQPLQDIFEPEGQSISSGATKIPSTYSTSNDNSDITTASAESMQLRKSAPNTELSVQLETELSNKSGNTAVVTRVVSADC